MSEDRVLEMGDGKGNWWPVGTVGAVDGLGPFEAVEPRHPVNVGTVGHVDYARRGRPAVVVIGATASQRELIARLTPDVVFFDEFSDVDVKALDSIDARVQARFIVTDEDQKKIVEMFDRLTEYPPLPVAVEPNWGGVGSFGARRGKKGKFKKDWQR